MQPQPVKKNPNEVGAIWGLLTPNNPLLTRAGPFHQLPYQPSVGFRLAPYAPPRVTKGQHFERPSEPLIECPSWVLYNYTLDKPSKEVITGVLEGKSAFLPVRKYWDKKSLKFLFIVGPYFHVMPNQNVEESLLWYEIDGKFIKRSENRIPNCFEYRGRCAPLGLCKKNLPQILAKQFPSDLYDIELYQHRDHGAVYAIALKKVVDANIKWYNQAGQHLYTTTCGWGCHSREQSAIDNQWRASVRFIDRC